MAFARVFSRIIEGFCKDVYETLEKGFKARSRSSIIL